MRVLGISGSLRSGSHNTALLREAARHMPDHVEFTLYDGLADVPPFDEDAEVRPAPGVERLRRALAEADAVLFATPEYNSSIPGHLKNAIDWASRPFETNPFRNLPVAVMGASTGMFGAMWAQADLRKVLAATGARVLDAELAVPGADHQLGGSDGLPEELDERLAELVSGLLREVRARVAA